MSNSVRIGIFSFYPLLWHKISHTDRYLYLNLETEITFASHPTGYTGSSMRPRVLFVLFQSPEYLVSRRHLVNKFQMNKRMLAE